MVNFSDIKKELLNRLRNQDLLSTTVRGVTTDSESLDGDNSTTDFALTQTNIKNIRSVTVGGTGQDYGDDWDFSYNSSTNIITISFTSAPASGTDNIVINYDYGTTDRIFSDFSEVFVSSGKYPRIAFDITTSATENLTIHSTPLLKNTLDIVFVGYGVTKGQTESLNDSIRAFIDANKTGFYTLNWLRKNGVSAISPVEGTNNKVFMRNNSYVAPFEFER